MATTALTTIKVECSGDGNDSEWSPTPTQNNYAPAGGPVNMTLAVGDNTIAVPTGAMGLAISPRASSATVLKLKGSAGDTGFALRGGKPSHVALPTGATSILVSSNAVDVVPFFWT